MYAGTVNVHKLSASLAGEREPQPYLIHEDIMFQTFSVSCAISEV